MTDRRRMTDRPKVAAQILNSKHLSISSTWLIREAAGQRQQAYRIKGRTDLLLKRRKQQRK